MTVTAERGRTYWIAVAGFAPRGRFRLKVASVAVPPNDDFVDALPLRVGSTVSGETTNATREMDEPEIQIPGQEGVHTVWYRFSVDSASAVRLDACGTRSRPDGAGVALYTGGRVDRLTRIWDGRDEPNEPHCSPQFTAQPGVIYRVALVAARGAAGGFRPAARIPTPPANDNFADATPISLGTTINSTTHDSTREPGEPANWLRFTVWYRLSVTETTTVEIDMCRRLFFSKVDVYTGARVDQLTLADVFQCEWPQSTLQPGVYSIQVATTSDEDFSFRPQPVAPPP